MRSWTFAVISLIAIFAQFFAPIARATAAPSAIEQIAADLKATFGASALLCVHMDDGSPGPAHSHSACDDCCPACGAGAGSVVLTPPPFVFSPPPTHAVRLTSRWTETDAPPPARASPAQPRAPPFEA